MSACCTPGPGDPREHQAVPTLQELRPLTAAWTMWKGHRSHVASCVSQGTGGRAGDLRREWKAGRAWERQDRVVVGGDIGPSGQPDCHNLSSPRDGGDGINTLLAASGTPREEGEAARRPASPAGPAEQSAGRGREQSEAPVRAVPAQCVPPCPVGDTQPPGREQGAHCSPGHCTRQDLFPKGFQSLEKIVCGGRQELTSF